MEELPENHLIRKIRIKEIFAKRKSLNLLYWSHWITGYAAGSGKSIPAAAKAANIELPYSCVVTCQAFPVGGDVEIVF
jgi:hypothetical protein